MKTNRAVPLEGKVVYYRTDGTGRDSYIHQINGGLLSHDKIHQLKQSKNLHERKFSFTKPNSKQAIFSHSKPGSNKFTHYISDGSGRDFYITSTEGGNTSVHRWRDHVDFRFRNTLRLGDSLAKQKNPQENDFFMKSQNKFTMTQSRFNRTMSLTQTNRSRELSTPKKTPEPPALDLYFGKNFDASKEFRKYKYGKNH